MVQICSTWTYFQNLVSLYFQVYSDSVQDQTSTGAIPVSSGLFSQKTYLTQFIAKK